MDKIVIGWIKLSTDTEHDIDGDQGGQNEQRLIGQRGLKGGRGSLEVGLQARRHIISFRTFDHEMASPSEEFSARLNETVIAGNCP